METTETLYPLAIEYTAPCYTRPKTRGELCDKLKQGVECEVVTSNVETSRILIDGWLGMEGKYGVRASERDGWSVFFLQNSPVQSREA